MTTSSTIAEAAPDALLFGKSESYVRTRLAEQGGLSVGLPTRLGLAMLQLDGPFRNRIRPPGDPFSPRAAGADFTVALLLPCPGDARRLCGGPSWRRGDPGPLPKSGRAIIVDVETGEPRPGWDLFVSALDGSAQWVFDSLARLLGLIGELAPPARGRVAPEPRRPPTITVSAFGLPEPTAWLSALSDADLLTCLRRGSE